MRTRIVCAGAVACVLLVWPAGAGAQGLASYDPFDVQAFNQTGPDGAEIPFTSAQPLSTSVAYGSEEYTTTPEERMETGLRDYTSCLLPGGQKVVGSRSGWTRFASGVAGAIRIDVSNFGYDLLVKVWRAPLKPPGQTPLAALIDHDCRDDKIGTNESLANVRVAANETLWVQTLTVCGRVPATTSWTTACSPESSQPGGPTTVNVTFTADNQDGDGVADSLDSCPTVAGSGPDGCTPPPPDPTPTPTPAPTASPSPTASPTPTPTAVAEAIAVQATTSIRYRRLGRRGLRILRFGVVASTGARIVVACTPRRACPRQIAAGRGVSRSVRFGRMIGRRIANGAGWTVTATRPGRVGLKTTFTVRNGAYRARRSCLVPGSDTATQRCPDD